MSSCRVSNLESTMADLKESGHQLDMAKTNMARKYQRALVLFTSAMGSCPCARGMKRCKCTCKKFKMAASQQDSIYREAMYNCHCTIGRRFGKCDNRHHIKALEFRAATFVAMGLLAYAMMDAEWILELAPHLPDGYLCLGNIAQLQNNDEYAWKMYTAGIEANQDTTVDSSPKLLELYDARKPLNRRFFRQDPLYLPAEIVTQIFSCLECDDLLDCLEVSKQWKHTLTSPLYAPLWRDLTLSDVDMHYGPSRKKLRKMLSWAGDGGARKIVITSCSTLDDSMLALLLEASPRLEHLEILDPPVDLSFPSNGNKWNRLKYFSLQGFDREQFDEPRWGDGPGGCPHSFLQNAASSLEHLELGAVPEKWYDEMPLIPHLPNLKRLRMSETVGYFYRPFPVFPLSIAFPNLEQLFIGSEILHLDPTPLSIWRERRQYIWPHLKVLIFEFTSSTISRYHIAETCLMLRNLMCLNRGNSLQHIRFHFHVESWINRLYRFDPLIRDFDDVQDLNFPNLRSFSSNFFGLSPVGARTLLSNSVQTQRLTSFDIVFSKHTVPGGASVCDLSHLRAYEWARGAPSVQALGFYQFGFWQWHYLEHHPLVEFVATFPNLRTLSIWSPYYELPQLAMLVGMILKVTHLETIYMLSVGHEAFAELRQAARNQGVRLTEMSEPRQWPVPLEA